VLVDEHGRPRLEYRLQRVGLPVLPAVVGHSGVGLQHDRGEAVDVVGDLVRCDAEDPCPGRGLVRVVDEEGHQLVGIA
jgi:hypothetical protein